MNRGEIVDFLYASFGLFGSVGSVGGGELNNKNNSRPRRFIMKVHGLVPTLDRMNIRRSKVRRGGGRGPQALL